MAVTKIHAIKATVGKAVSYICDEKKTDGKILISSFGCAPETAAIDFKFALSKTSPSDKNLAFHLIQSFAPDEVSFDEAHRIGNELAERLLEGKYSYIVSTHIDRNHIHNHTIFCAADNIDHKKYNDCKKTYWQIRRTSDELCREHNLSVIDSSEKRGLKYKEWQTRRDGKSWKKQITSDIDSAIKSASSYDDFIAVMRQKNYEIKGEALNDPHSKYISFRAAGKERFVRGSEKTLGKNYTKESIVERIERDVKQRAERKANRIKNPDYSSRSLIDVTQEKFEESYALKRWADLQNLKTAAAAYSSAGSIAELEKKASEKTAIARDARRSIVELEHSMRELGEIIRYADQYQSNKRYQTRYEKSKNPEAYFEAHEYELTLFAGAENMLKRFGVKPSSLDIDKLKADYTEMASEKKQLQQIYKSLEKETASMRKKLEVLEQYLGQTEHGLSSEKGRGI